MKRIKVTFKIGLAFTVDGSATIQIIAADSEKVTLLIESTEETKICREALRKPAKKT